MTHVIFIKLGRYRKRSILDVSSAISYTFYNLLTGKEMSCKNGVASRRLISKYITICNENLGSKVKEIFNINVRKLVRLLIEGVYDIHFSWHFPRVPPFLHLRLVLHSELHPEPQILASP